MKLIAIIGAGQLGSRHLQGAKRANEELDIWVVDPNDTSLEVAKERYEQVNSVSPKSVHFLKDIDELPVELDIAIISTSSKPRFSIIKKLVTHSKIKYMLLEKFLFTKLIDYEDAFTLIEEHSIETWVNCPYRIQPCYNLVASNIDLSNKVHIEFRGKGWGLCCNAIHYIDLLMWLSNESTFSINMNDIIPQIIESKRAGHIELEGTLKVETPNGNTLILESDSNYEGDKIVQIRNGGNLILVDEWNGGSVKINGKEYDSKLYYQSDLTGILLDTILTTGRCGLVQYNESMKYHKKFIEVLLPFVNSLQGYESDFLPIT